KVVAEIVAQLRGKTIRAPDISYTSKEIDCQLDAQQNWSFKGDPFTPTLLLKLETFQVIQKGIDAILNMDGKMLIMWIFLPRFTLEIWQIKHVISQQESVSPEPVSFYCSSCSKTFTDSYNMIKHMENTSSIGGASTTENISPNSSPNEDLSNER
ncbi:18692_t:CDS:2, partial [Entrophospora sp. SA101]